jgi:hypothetical protein
MMTFLLHIKIDFKEQATLLEMEDLQLLVLLHYLGCMAIWKPRSTTLSKKHIVQSFGPSKLNLMQSLGYLFISSVFICLINIVFISSESLCVIII